MGEFYDGGFNGVGAGVDAAGMRLLLCTLALAAVVGTGLAQALPNVNPANRLANVPIDDYQYDHATDCEKKPEARHGRAAALARAERRRRLLGNHALREVGQEQREPPRRGTRARLASRLAQPALSSARPTG